MAIRGGPQAQTINIFWGSCAVLAGEVDSCGRMKFWKTRSLRCDIYDGVKYVVPNVDLGLYRGNRTTDVPTIGGKCEIAASSWSRHQGSDGWSKSPSGAPGGGAKHILNQK